MGISDLLGPGIQEQWESVYGSSQLGQYAGSGSATATSIMAQQASAQNQISAMQNQMTANAAMGVSPYQNVYGGSSYGTMFGFRAVGVKKADLDHPLYDVPIRTLQDLWGAKFGMRWVTLQELENLDDLDRSWITIFRRLRSMHVIEDANTFDSNEQLYRLPPE
jgi:hypothetical protein